MSYREISRLLLFCFIASKKVKFCAFVYNTGQKAPFTLQSADVFLFHTPYCKLVQKSVARLMLNDYLSDENPDFDTMFAGLEKFRYNVCVLLNFYFVTSVPI